MDFDIILFIFLLVVICGAVMGALIGFFFKKNSRKSAKFNFIRGAIAGIPAFIISILIALFTALAVVEPLSDLVSAFDSKRSAKNAEHKANRSNISPTPNATKNIRRHTTAIFDDKEDSIIIRKEVAQVVKKANSLTGISTIEFDTDDDGFLRNPDDWNAQWVYFVMKSEGIEKLTEEHERVIAVLRIYYKRNGIAPMVRVLSKVTGFKLKHIYELFPSGPGKGACKMAGLPKPTGCV